MNVRIMRKETGSSTWEDMGIYHPAIVDEAIEDMRDCDAHWKVTAEYRTV